MGLILKFVAFTVFFKHTANCLKDKPGYILQNSSGENPSTREMDKQEQEDKASIVVTNFINLMDNPHEMYYDLSEDAVLDWFGRSVLGRNSIVRFIRINFFKIQHTIEKIQVIPPINHRLLKHFTKHIVTSTDYVMKCGSDRDCQVTPENLIRPNQDKLIKAPQKLIQQCSVNFKHWQFVEFTGKMQFDRNSKHVVKNKNSQRIILGYSDQIHLIVYEPQNMCLRKKKLIMRNLS